ncbi:hypothetical protein H0H87_011016 [Tephrocybe sp. NHM501043]|nr:hypothetical protein H0H87_011016 [Tephrocybe sp. NHM501043]
MSSFKRKGSVKQASVPPGTRISPATTSTIITSTGIPSFDDILGGGLPLSCSVLIAAPDLHSSYGDLVQKYFVAQGLASAHNLCVVDDNADTFVKDIMWTPVGRNGATAPDSALDEEDQPGQQGNQKIKIAWRYEQMKPFQTTVPASSLSATNEYCNSFDLSSRMPISVIEKAHQSGQLSFLSSSSQSTSARIIFWSLPTSYMCPVSGFSSVGRIESARHFVFLAFASKYSEGKFSCMRFNKSRTTSYDRDAAFTLSAFSADPSLTMTFPNHHGLLHIHTLPAPHSILPPSDKFSTLRGLSASAGGTGGSGENNLTFKSTRKRLIFETLHLDIEGGVGERRTTPSTIAIDTTGKVHEGTHDHSGHASKGAAFATVQVALEESEDPKAALNATDGGDKAAALPEGKPKKPKKQVAFRADRPDLYDF